MKNVMERLGVSGIPRFARIPLKVDVPRHVVEEQPDSGKAFTLACTASGLTNKEIYQSLPLNQGWFAKIQGGTAVLPEHLVPRFCAIVGNTIYTDWRKHHFEANLPAQQALVAAERAAEELRGASFHIPKEMVHG